MLLWGVGSVGVAIKVESVGLFDSSFFFNGRKICLRIV